MTVQQARLRRILTSPRFSFEPSLPFCGQPRRIRIALTLGQNQTVGFTRMTPASCLVGWKQVGKPCWNHTVFIVSFVSRMLPLLGFFLIKHPHTSQFRPYFPATISLSSSSSSSTFPRLCFHSHDRHEKDQHQKQHVAYMNNSLHLQCDSKDNQSGYDQSGIGWTEIRPANC